MMTDSLVSAFGDRRLVGAAFSQLAAAHAEHSAHEPASVGGNVIRAWLEAAMTRLDPRVDRIVDVGGGAGRWALPLAQHNYRVTLLDCSAGMLRLAADEAHRRQVAWLYPVLADAEVLPLPSGASYALALVVGEVLGYTARPERALAEVARVLQPGGVLIGTVASRTGMALAALRQPRLGLDPQVILDSGLICERSASEIGEDQPLVLRAFDPAALGDLLAAAGFTVRRLVGRDVLRTVLETRLMGAAPDRALESRLDAEPALLGLSKQLLFWAERDV